MFNQCLLSRTDTKTIFNWPMDGTPGETFKGAAFTPVGTIAYSQQIPMPLGSKCSGFFTSANNYFSSSATILNTLKGLSPYTIEMYVMVTDITAASLAIGMFDGTNAQSFEVRGALSNMEWQSPNNNFNEFGNVTNNAWYHIALTWDGATRKAYVNNVQATITQIGAGGDSALMSGLNELVIGVRYNTHILPLNGYICGLRISSIARTKFPTIN